MSNTFSHDDKHPIALRGTIDGFSGGTRVEYVQTNEDGTVVVICRNEMLTLQPHELVHLRTRTLELPGAELRRKMEALLGHG